MKPLANVTSALLKETTPSHFGRRLGNPVGICWFVCGRRGSRWNAAWGNSANAFG